MDKQDFMRRAIAISRHQVEQGLGSAFGAVVVKDGVIVGEGGNTVTSTHDATAHGEVVAIRDAGQKLGTWDLSGCELYTSCEPCAMCVAAIHWARIDKLYYANTLKDAEDIGYDVETLKTLVRTAIAERTLPSERLLAEEARAVLDDWAKMPGFQP
ncbi:nucleoside deaminase [Zavarzinia sp. CC-PAN008]|uniref:nucleoside deaminase n=1 Tax=Zavarzinia sp. CC-PAN008 TaxID=3243332 RepID=UPI003F747ECB